MEKTGDDGGVDRAAFEKYLSALRGRVGEAKYRSWFFDLSLAERTRTTVLLSTASAAKRDMLDDRYLPVMVDTWRREIGPVERFALTVRKAMKTSDARSKVDDETADHAATAIQPENALKEKAPFASLGAPLDPRRAFDAYAVGDTNGVGFAAARQALDPSAPRELVYFYGESGVGKTHLLQAVCQAWNDRGESKSLYVTYRNLVNACVSAALSNATQALHAEVSRHDLLSFDDIHFLEGKERTQEELLIMIDSALDSGRSVAIAGDLPPAKLAEAGLNKRLADRLAGGLCAPIHPADEALRLQILKKRMQASTAKCRLSEDVLEFIARNFAQSTRETIGALNQVLLIYGGQDMTVDLAAAKDILKSRLDDRRKAATMDDAIAAGAEIFGLSVAEIRGRAQPQRIVRGRHAIVWCAREVLRESFPRIGKAMGRDHTTVMSSYRRAQALIERDKVFQERIARIREALGQ